MLIISKHETFAVLNSIWAIVLFCLWNHFCLLWNNWFLFVYCCAVEHSLNWLNTRHTVLILCWWNLYMFGLNLDLCDVLKILYSWSVFIVVTLISTHMSWFCGIKFTLFIDSRYIGNYTLILHSCHFIWIHKI